MSQRMIVLAEFIFSGLARIIQARRQPLFTNDATSPKSITHYTLQAKLRVLIRQKQKD